MTGRWRALAVASLASVVAVSAGVAVSSPPTVAPAPLSHSLAELDTLTMAVTRAPFCDWITPADVAATVGSTTPTATSWRNGETVALSGTADVANEHGCRWTDGPRSASAWIFAPPVTVAEAEALITAAKAVKGCMPLAGAPAFGSPSIALTCGDTVSFRGLYGDAWLVCTVSGPVPTATALAPRWCASVALALRV